jgi:[ribosomal protein S18]-alanine N-acetyltransferase
MQTLPALPAGIRDYRPQDLSTLLEIDKICFHPDIAFSRSELLFYVRHPRSISRIAEQQGHIIGFAVGRVEEGSLGHILTLDVVPEARRSGTGTLLMTTLHDEFRRRQVTLSLLEVNAEDEGARRFYEKLEYQYTEIVRGYYYGRLDAYRMVCFL